MKKKKDAYIVKSTKFNFGEFLFFSIAIILYLLLSLYFEKYRSIFGYGGGDTNGRAMVWNRFWILLYVTLFYTLYLEINLIRSKKDYFHLLFFFFVSYSF